jgi:hypothetical protein
LGHAPLTRNLIRRLDAVNGELAAGNTAKACALLQRFSDFVGKRQSNGHVEFPQAEQLVTATLRIRHVLDCP